MGEGMWTVVVQLACGRHEYKVIVDGEWRVDESVEKVHGDMGSWNNVLHVEEDKDEEVQETDVEVNKHEEVEETDVKEDKAEEVEGSDVEEGRNEELNETDENDVTVSHVDKEITREVPDISMESEDEDKRESGPDPNLVMKRAVVMMQKLREVECAVQNLVLTSPVRVTRGKIRKFVKENNSTPAVC